MFPRPTPGVHDPSSRLGDRPLSGRRGAGRRHGITAGLRVLADRHRGRRAPPALPIPSALLAGRRFPHAPPAGRSRRTEGCGVLYPSRWVRTASPPRPPGVAHRARGPQETPSCPFPPFTARRARPAVHPPRAPPLTRGCTVADVRRLPGSNTDRWDWQVSGMCRGLDSAVFFHPDDERGEARQQRDERAKSLCRQCPVQQQCRTHALTVREPYGVWGGLSAEERGQLLHVRSNRQDHPVNSRRHPVLGPAPGP